MIKVIYFSLVVLTLSSCKEILEKDISNDLPVIVLPAENSNIESNPVKFKWGALEGATKYRLQVVSPSFENIIYYPIDSVVNSTEVLMNLDSNSYEVRLMAFNAGYETEFTVPSPFSLTSGVSNELNVILTSPVNEIYNNGIFNDSFDGEFTWGVLNEESVSYEFTLREAPFQTGNIIEAHNLSGVTIDLSSSLSLTEGKYIWGVKAYYQSGETSFSTFSINIDETAPNIPSLDIPSNETFLSQGLNAFSWFNGVDLGAITSPVISTIEIATDINFNNVILTDTFEGNETEFDLTASGFYYWRVFNDDEAGNQGDYSDVNSFTVN